MGFQLDLFSFLTKKQKAKPSQASFRAKDVSVGAASSTTVTATEGSPPVQIEYSLRMRSGWHASWHSDGRTSLRVPYLIKYAPESVHRNLQQWAQLTRKKGGKRKRGWPLNPDDRKALAAAETAVMEFLGEGRVEPGSPGSEDPRLKQWLRGVDRKNRRRIAGGMHHDLREIFDALNRQYFEGDIRASIAWSNRVGGLSFHRKERSGEGTRNIISISRGYDFPDVPPHIVGGVVYHEMLHIAVPPYLKNGFWVYHGPEFRRRERAYAHYREWQHWHRHELPKKLRTLRRQKKR